MGSLINFRPYYEVLERVDETRARLRAIRIAEGLMALATTLALVVLVTTALQAWWHFGPWVRLAMLTAWLAALVLSIWRFAVVPFRWDPNDKEVARFLETRLPELGNNLINTILLAEEANQWSPPMVERAIGEAAAGARSVDLWQAVSRRRVNRWAIIAAAALLALGLFAALRYQAFSQAATQILMPFTHVRNIGGVDPDQVTVRPGTVVWIKGEPLDIEAIVRGADDRPIESFVDITEGAAPAPSRKPMPRDSGAPGRFVYRVPQVLQPFTYRVTVAGTESYLYQVTLREPPMIEGIDLVYKYPDYTGLAPQKAEGSGGEIRCLVGTMVDMRVRVSAKVEGGSLVFGSGAVRQCVAEGEGRVLQVDFPVMQNDTYKIYVNDSMPEGASVVYPITALRDEPPLVQFTLPNRDVAAAPGQTVKMALKAADDYGLGEVRLMSQAAPKADENNEPQVAASWKKFDNPKDAALDFVFVIDPARYKLGQTIVYWAEAADRRTYQGGSTPKEPNRSTTGQFKIVVEDRKAAAEQQLQQLQRLFDRLREILKTQEQTRSASDTLATLAKLGDVQSAGSAQEKAQKGVRDATLAVTRQVAFDSETMPIRATLEALAANEMASAMTKANSLAGLADMGGVGPLAKRLMNDQATIIATLRQILDITEKLSNAVKESEKRLDPSDLPPDELAKLKALHDRLKEFVNEQKKVIEASRDLTKKPVDDFTDTDQKNLDQLKAIEDQWDKFMTEAIADFSKIPDVDASNPSLVKELIEVKADVEMAADALSKKAMDVTVPLEELGMEAAKEIVENLERWLPDTPDRAKWKQEEFTADVEVPHAELPQQMEDLVGDLLEQEEDLFAEMDDITSGAADSADKGAGWDAMDGPISNFSAKGVTGNQLPNSTEISGRSGEGRSGKASGEFVEDEATGKGGRKTPTRLTPEPFSKGEIKDSSPESPGGATGGGKISDAGNEGLEGPVPPDIQRRMGSLAGKQAQLRNKAEGVKAALQVKNYDSFALDKAMDGMRRVQRDLLAGRYSSALRQKDVVVDNLKDTKMLLGGEVRIRQDASSAVPSEVRKDVLDALEKPMPRGYEEYLKKYYERLSEGK